MGASFRICFASHMIEIHLKHTLFQGFGAGLIRPGQCPELEISGDRIWSTLRQEHRIRRTETLEEYGELWQQFFLRSSLTGSRPAGCKKVQKKSEVFDFSLTQTLYYITSQKDGPILRALVGIVLAFDIIHQALITHTGYIYLVSDPTKIHTVIWSLLHFAFSGHMPFAVSGKISFVLAEFACIIGFQSSSLKVILTLRRLLRVRTFEELTIELKGLSVVVNALAVASDLLIASTLTFILQCFKSGFKKSDTMINKLTILAINTGAVTSLCALASLVSARAQSILAAPDSFIYISFFFSIGRLYTNALLASLNTRPMIKDAENSNAFADVDSHITKLVFKHSTSTDVSVQVDPIVDTPVVEIFLETKSSDRTIQSFGKCWGKMFLKVTNTHAVNYDTYDGGTVPLSVV
ncbi:hypothetical protein C8J55DRAFT_493282 [Lentinula edodes]|uniref:DUF6534 domain-containing protein n=1 Tax=Lentinula lateritia TaxID=40482 RepID=A0A9W8ZSK0_9AGAR|nr:hypothetical protein C8J55DRAFT_493282 [Lentinula edodes]